MRDAVAAIFADRANLAATLVDARGVVRSLRSLLGGVVHAACCFLYLAIWDVRSSLFFFGSSPVFSVRSRGPKRRRREAWRDSAVFGDPRKPKKFERSCYAVA